ncbi:uncharacterized protein LOC134751249 [Cydia strobilella]|uniref:uncharacterized protein LOC134751249 n=1 Tax=Cydia strobilella TaxID=1100964 RepID=UPI003007D013
MEENKNIHITPEEEVLHSAVSEYDMFNAYTDIIKAFCLSNKVYQFPILSTAIPTGMRKTCKNVLRLNRATLLKMSAFGMFELDATFPLRLFSVIVTYTVVLLQFAFVS